jgi:hypothetical protein
MAPHRLRRGASHDAIAQWFDGATLRQEADQVTLAVPDADVEGFIRRHYQPALAEVTARAGAALRIVHGAAA